MAITKEKKRDLISQYKRNKNDSGSPEVQVAILTEKIKSLSTHLTSNPKDYQSQLGLQKMVGKRKSLTSYLNKQSPESYRKILDQLGIRN